MITLDEQQDQFSLVGERLKRKVDCFVIGGSAMMYYNAKDATKDIDLVFSEQKSRQLVLRVLKGLGFKERNTRMLYFDKEDVPILVQRGDHRFDMFLKTIVGFKLSDSIKDRATAVYEYHNLTVKVVSPEDIILLKCATERAGDRADTAELIRRFDINWDIVIEEATHQTKIGGELFPVFLYDFLMELKEDLKADIPPEVIKRIRKIGEEMMVKTLKKGQR